MASKKTVKNKTSIKCRVVSYNPSRNIIVYQRPDNTLVQTNELKYDGSGFINIKVEAEEA